MGDQITMLHEWPAESPGFEGRGQVRKETYAGHEVWSILLVPKSP